MSANLFTPDQDTYSVCRVFGRWCKLGEERRIRDGWCFSRYWLRELGMVALVKMRLNGYDIGVVVGVECIFSFAIGVSSSGADTTGIG